MTTTKEKLINSNQAGMAKMYLFTHSLNTIFTRSQWYRWGGKVWSPIHDAIISKELKKCMKVGYTAGMLSQVQKLIQIDLFTLDDVMDSDPEQINLDNGIYHLGKDKLLPHHSDHHMTTILPFAYDPKAKCPYWEKYLQTTFVDESGKHDPEMVQLIQEAFGYSLTTSTEHQIMFWCFGDGSNGKGTLFYVLAKLLGSACMELDIDGLPREQYQLADVAGKRVITSAEVNNPNKMAEYSKVKALVAGDPMKVRQIRQEPFDMNPTAKLWWAMNSLPPIDETSTGVWRRIRIIPFYKKFEEREKILNLKTLLDNELAGIFNWALVGLRRSKANGTIVIPANAATVKAEYQHDSNIVQVFKEDSCKCGAEFSANKTEFYKAFKTWCVDNGHKVRTSTQLKQELKKLGIHDHKSHGTWVYTGIELNDSPDEINIMDAIK